MTDPVPTTDCPRADLAALLFAALYPALFTWVYFVALADAPGALQQTVYAAGKTLQFAFPLVWVFLIRRAWPAWRRPQRAGMLEAVGFGLVVMAGMLLLYHLWLKPIGYLTPTSAAGLAVAEKIRGFGVKTLAGYIALAAFYSVLHSLLEEYYWRWFVFGRLRRFISLGPAIALASVAFMLHHVVVLGFYFGWLSPAAWVFSLAVGIGGAAWAWIYHRTGTLWGVWLSHALIDAAIFAVGFDLVFAR